MVAPALGQSATLRGRVEVRSGTNEKTHSETKPAKSNISVVWLTPVSGQGSKAELGPKQHPRLTQRNKTFEPHVLVVPVGAQVEFPNRDPFFHNVFSLFDGKRFDLGLYEAGESRLVRFDRVGISYIFCNIHAQMSAVVIALDTPYFGVSDSAGIYAMPAPPAGRYSLHIWNERASPESLIAASKEINVDDSGSSLATIHLIENPAAAIAHKNKYGRDYDQATPVTPVYTQP